MGVLFILSLVFALNSINAVEAVKVANAATTADGRAGTTACTESTSRLPRDLSTFFQNLFLGNEGDHDFVISGLPNEKKCRSRGCREISAFLRNNMDSSADPCEDFWEFACGGWRNKSIPKNKLTWGPLQILYDRISSMQKRWLESRSNDSNNTLHGKVRLWYDTCMNEAAMEKNVAVLNQLIQSIGGWYAAGTLKSNWTVHEGILSLQQKNILMPFYEAKIVKDDKNVSRNLIKLYQPNVIFEKTPHYYERDKTDPIISGYLRSISRFAVHLGLDPTQADHFANSAFGFEKKLAGILVSYDSQEWLNAENTYNIVKVKNLTNLCKFLRLRDHFQELSPDYFSNDDQDVLVFNVEFFDRLSKLLRNSTNEELNNYMVWALASSAERFLPRRFRDALNAFRLVRFGHKQKLPRWLQCARSIPYPFVIGSEFVRNFFPRQSRDYALEVINAVREEFSAGLNSSDWMDDDTKAEAIEKLKKMENRIGYPSFILDEENLNQHYRNIQVTDNASLLQQRLEHIEYAKKVVLESLWIANNRSEWYTNPMTVNAYYSRVDNSITFPAGILQPPLFKKDYPSYHNFGSMGYVMSHEIVHAFDYNGAKYDSQGNLKEWMTTNSTTQYEQRNQCIRNFYSGLHLGGRKINGNITLGENIADIAGLKYAFRAYQAAARVKFPSGEPTLPGLHISPEKTFFLSFAAFHCKKWRPTMLDTLLSRSHAPAKTRVNGAVSQSADFARAFRCPVGSRMNPTDKCRVF